jgi:mono/diheme cytochrome c family protein
MFQPKWLIPLLSLLALLAVVSPVRAGGWTVVTLDELPPKIRAGEPLRIGFQVMQHGIHPLVLAPDVASVVVRQQASGELLIFTAQPDTEAGHYTVELVLPQAGRWTWEIQPGTFPPAPMPELTVAQSPSPSSATPMWRQVAIQWLTYLLDQPETGPVNEPAPPVRESAEGQALFLAKGCATCHLHGAVQTTFTVQAGPDLTEYKVIPEYVRLWLKDPASIKPATKMPQLHLSETEIEALITFLSSNGK